MAIINNSYKFIFVHVPKVAGTTITNDLSRYSSYCDLELGGTTFGEEIQTAYKNRFGLSKHSPARRIRSVVGSVTWNRYFSFSFVRNPYRRAISAFNFYRKWEAPDKNFTKKMKSFTSFEEFVLSGYWDETSGPDGGFMPQNYWLRGEEPSETIVDYVGKLENLREEMNSISNLLELPKWRALKVGEMSVLNRSSDARSDDLKNDLVVESILKKYQIDFSKFGYSIDPAEAFVKL